MFKIQLNVNETKKIGNVAQQHICSLQVHLVHKAVM